MEFISMLHKDRFKVAGSFEDDLYTGMSKDFSKFFTKARNIGNSDEDIFLTFKPLFGFIIAVADFILDSLIIPSGSCFYVKLFEVVHFFSQDFRSWTNIFTL